MSQSPRSPSLRSTGPDDVSDDVSPSPRSLRIRSTGPDDVSPPSPSLSFYDVSPPLPSLRSTAGPEDVSPPRVTLELQRPAGPSEEKLSRQKLYRLIERNAGHEELSQLLVILTPQERAQLFAPPGDTGRVRACVFDRTVAVAYLHISHAVPFVCHQWSHTTSPVYYAAYLGHQSIVQVLLSHDCPIEVRTMTFANWFHCKLHTFLVCNRMFHSLGSLCCC